MIENFVVDYSRWMLRAVLFPAVKRISTSILVPLTCKQYLQFPSLRSLVDAWLSSGYENTRMLLGFTSLWTILCPWKHSRADKIYTNKSLLNTELA